MKPSTGRRKFGDCAAVKALALPLLISVLACSEHAPDTPDVEHNASVAWTVTLAGNGNHRVEGLAADRDGNIFATGTFSGQLELESGTLEANSDDAIPGQMGQPRPFELAQDLRRRRPRSSPRRCRRCRRQCLSDGLIQPQHRLRHWPARDGVRIKPSSWPSFPRTASRCGQAPGGRTHFSPRAASKWVPGATSWLRVTS